MAKQVYTRLEDDEEAKFLEFKARNGIKNDADTTRELIRLALSNSFLNRKVQLEKAMAELQELNNAYRMKMDEVHELKMKLENDEYEKKRAEELEKKRKEWADIIRTLPEFPSDEQMRPILDEIAKWSKDHNLKISVVDAPLKKIPQFKTSLLVGSYEDPLK